MTEIAIGILIPDAIGILIPVNISNDIVEIVHGVCDIVDGVVIYYQCDIPDCDLDKLENSGFEGEGKYINNKLLNDDEYPLE